MGLEGRFFFGIPPISDVLAFDQKQPLLTLAV